MSQTTRNPVEPDPAREVPGEEADRPSEIGRAGWVQIAKRGWAEAKADQVPLLAAGLAYYGFLAIFPALVATVTIYGLLADPSRLADRVSAVMSGLPPQARDLIVDQLRTLGARQASLTVGAIIAVVIALWSASGGVNQLLTAISAAYDEDENRSFLAKRGLALAVTVAAIVFMIIVVGLVAVLPALVGQSDLSGPLRWLLQAVRWILIAAVVTVALALLYRIGPDRDAPKMRWVSVGAMVATVLWLIASIGFSIYVSTFGNYAKTYGAVAGIVVMLLWLWMTSYAVLLGAEINAESEQQTARDSTRGPEQPLGERGAVKADTVPGSGSEDSQDTANGRPTKATAEDARPSAAVTARDLMTEDIHCLSEDESLRTAAQVMRDLDLDALPICGKDNRLTGVVTIRDLIRAFADGESHDSSTGSLAHGRLVTIGADDSAEQALQTMTRHELRALPVVDGHTLVGTLTQTDVARALPSDAVTRQLAERSAH